MRNLISKKSVSAFRRFQSIESLERRVVFSGDAFAAVSDSVAVGDTVQVAAESTDDLGQPERRIVNGTNTNGHASVGIVNNGCSGTLIAPTFVLTAAHCTVGVADSAGTFDVGGQTISTINITDHPQYNDNQFDAGYDISIMELSRPASGITPSAILRTAPVAGETLTLVGFGEGGTSQNGSLFDFGTKRVGTTELEEVTPLHLNWTLDSHAEANTAPGDSGGPAFVDRGGTLVVAGVTSGGDNDAHQLQSGSFDTRVDVFQNWIDSVVGTTPDPNPEPNPGPDPEPNPEPEPEPEPNPEPEPEPNPGPDFGDDHADTFDEATFVELFDDGAGFEFGELEVEGDRDMFVFDLEDNSDVTISAASTDGALDTYLRLYDEFGDLVALNDDSGFSLDSELTLELQPGSYFFSVGSYADEGVGEYDVNLLVDPIQDDTGDAIFADAIDLDFADGDRIVVRDEIVDTGAQNVYSIDAESDGTMVVRVLGQQFGFDSMVTIFDSNGEIVDFNDDWRGTDSRVRFDVDAGETYYVMVEGYGDSTGQYRMVARQITNQFRAATDRFSAIDRLFAGFVDNNHRV